MSHRVYVSNSCYQVLSASIKGSGKFFCVEEQRFSCDSLLLM